MCVHLKYILKPLSLFPFTQNYKFGPKLKKKIYRERGKDNKWEEGSRRRQKEIRIGWGWRNEDKKLANEVNSKKRRNKK